MVAAPESIRMLPDREQVLRMSYDEFVMRVEEHAHAEWVDGEAIIFMSPKDRHQALVLFLALLVGGFADWLGLGTVRTGPYKMRAVHGGPVREPDLLFVMREHEGRVTADGLTGPADLVVEIISEESVKRDRDVKFYEFEAAGIPEYWLFDSRPRRERAEFYRLDEYGKYQPVVLDSERRYHSLVLPKFWLKPEWLWQHPLPSPNRLLARIAPQIAELMRQEMQGE